MQLGERIKLLDEALSMRKSGKWIEALGRFELLERKSSHPNDISKLRFFEATCLTDMGRPEDARLRMSHVEKSRLEHSDQIDYEYESARIERALGFPAEALRIVEGALEEISRSDSHEQLRVVSSNLTTLLGILLAETGRCDEAIRVLEVVPSEDEGWAEAKLHEGDCKYKKRYYQEAIDCYLNIVSSPNNVHSFYRDAALRNIGYAYHDLGQHDLALKYLLRVENSYEDEPSMRAELFGVIASLYVRLGMIEQAHKYERFSRGTDSIH